VNRRVFTRRFHRGHDVLADDLTMGAVVQPVAR
jgi:hypothetical protein